MVYLYAFSVIAIFSVAVLLHLTGFSRKAKLSGPEDAAGLFLSDFPDEDIREVVLVNSNRTALLSLQRPGALGVVTAAGSKWRSRTIEAGELLSVTERRKGVIHLRLRSYTEPSLHIRFADDADAGPWAARMRALVTPRPGENSDD